MAQGLIHLLLGHILHLHVDSLEHGNLTVLRVTLDDTIHKTEQLRAVAVGLLALTNELLEDGDLRLHGGGTVGQYLRAQLHGETILTDSHIVV